MIHKAYDKFQRSLWAHRLTRWISNKFDCDDYAWSFRASCVIGNALSRNAHANPVGLICYLQDGDMSRSHAINNAVVSTDAGSEVVEIEPQPKSGIVNLSEVEIQSVYLVLI